MWNERQFWIVFSLGVLVLSPLIFIIGFVFGMNISGKISLSADSISSWVSALATLAIAVLTFILAKETWKLRIAQMNQVDEIRKESVRPSVNIYLSSSPVSLQFMNVNVENSGVGLARNIEFRFDPENKVKFTEGEEFIIEKFLRMSMFSNGISSLGVGGKRKSFAFSFIDIGRMVGGDIFDIKFKITASYSDVDGRLYKMTSVFDLSEYKGISERGGGDPAYRVAKEIENIRRILEGAQDGIYAKRFNVNTFNSNDREKDELDIDDFVQSNINE